MPLFQPPLPKPEAVLDEYFQQLGYPKIEDVPSQIKAIAVPTLEKVISLGQPLAMYEVTEIQEVGEAAIICQGMEISSRLWAELMGKTPEPRKAAVFAVTLGKKLEEESARIQEKAMAMGFFMHAAGAVVAEKAADAVQFVIGRDPAFEGLVMSRRFSPGYCDWPTEGQKELFEFLKPEKIGITASEGWAMTPSKSVTGAIAFAPELPSLSPCKSCPSKDCDHRRK
ncbi:Vitamin B12 dependent methionine synthase, activation domain [Desulfatibacillum alkenivorans DSM 16219]|jgi:hypothetical protein|uniref:Vitamin B12 dependent methionine synthase, activation domain n=1 Tax=Desulfatibacillum alkenivorans DSM 16219 TaxID=1121393 RepID=A0A1M6MQV4_9BACT|nr:vitamin B12 dependent-methionine synthase activation domain-containing protein [Desulfatibacillum alkenivorans]SHJ85776.1 Vitamin B12 dependent methionine synthase, activation domain [Desulfatibacillum alkenivorans DSM 16219]